MRAVAAPGGEGLKELLVGRRRAVPAEPRPPRGCPGRCQASPGVQGITRILASGRRKVGSVKAGKGGAEAIRLTAPGTWSARECKRGENMPRFLVRTNCEYSIEIEAANADEAIEKAQAIDVEEWSQAWADVEAEELEDGP